MKRLFLGKSLKMVVSYDDYKTISGLMFKKSSKKAYFSLFPGFRLKIAVLNTQFKVKSSINWFCTYRNLQVYVLAMKNDYL